ncbi:MAG: D-alanyl-D-alanine carboxypeptidase family protein [Bacillota bacterium]
MKNKFNQILYTILTLILLLVGTKVSASEIDFELTAKSAVLMEAETGEIIFEKNSDEQLPPASMTKIMTMLLVMEAIDEERVNLDDKIVTSENAASMGGSQIWLEPGEEMTLKDLMKAIAIVSANDACVAVAEHLYGTEENFVNKMNEKVEELGLENTSFYNTNGLPSGDDETQGNYTSAKDLAIMSRELLKYPKILEWTSTWIDYLRDGDSVLNNTNWLVRHIPGADGLKTGFTSEAGHCVTGTAKRGDLRFVSVIMDAESSKARFSEAADLISYGFNIYETSTLAEADEVIDTIYINNASNPETEIVVKDKLTIPVKKGSEADINKEIKISEELKAPLEKGDKAGVIKVYKGNLLIKEADLVVNRDVSKASIWKLFIRMIKNLIEGMLNIF